jgi:hypothetical protein
MTIAHKTIQVAQHATHHFDYFNLYYKIFKSISLAIVTKHALKIFSKIDFWNDIFMYLFFAFPFIIGIITGIASCNPYWGLAASGIAFVLQFLLMVFFSHGSC